VTPVVRAVADDPHLWQHLVRYDRGSRYWARIATLPGADLWLLTWLPDQKTDLHDHGDAAASFTVVHGTLTETRVHPGGLLVDSVMRAGDVHEVPAGAVHDVGNRGLEPAISIHAYSPALTTMNFWEPVPGGLRRLQTVYSDQPEVA
jgi:mannose-6-phosphate isomerase-like protein (cupin superfamily)